MLPPVASTTAITLVLDDNNDFMLKDGYDTVSANVMIRVPQLGESGQMVSEKVKRA